MVDVFWNRLAPSLAVGQGYLAADKLRVGMDNESRASLNQSIDWVRGEWRDHDDGFDYAKAANTAKYGQRLGLLLVKMTLCWGTPKMSPI